MPLGTNHQSPGNPGIEDFIPEQWGDLVVAAYDAKTAMKEIVTIVPHSANRGDTIVIPVEGPNVSPAAKQFQTEVTLQQHDSSNVRLVVNKQFEFSRLN